MKPESTLKPPDRFTRQADLVPQDKLTSLTATVIGVGAVGRQVALQLAAIGVCHVQLLDHDYVEPTNITTQGYGQSDLGLPKVLATQQTISQMDPAVKVTPILDRFRPRYPTGEVLFCCVDKIAAREAIWRSLRQQCQFWADSRMLGETVRVLAAATEDHRDHYQATLFPSSEAEPGRCTSRSTIYGASLCGALMVHQFTRWLRDLPLDRDLTFNLLASELVFG